MGKYFSILNTGKKLTPETREKLRQANLGKKHSAETKHKISLANKGRSYSPETIEKYRQSKLGPNNPMYGKKISEMHRKHLSEARMGKRLSEETRKKISLKHKGGTKPKMTGDRLVRQRELLKRIQQDALIQKKRAEKRKGIPLSQSTREKISKAHLGKTISDVVKKNLSIKIKQKWAEDPVYRNKISETLKQKWRQYPEKHPNFIMGKKGFVSRPQKAMYNLVKEYFPTAILNYPVNTKMGMLFPDVGIPDLKIGFEYDGEYWHKDRKDHDKQRLENLKDAGWEMFCFTDKSISDITKILCSIKENI